MSISAGALTLRGRSYIYAAIRPLHSLQVGAAATLAIGFTRNTAIHADVYHAAVPSPSNPMLPAEPRKR